MFEQALAFYQQGKLSQAERKLKSTLEIQPQHPDALHFLGIIALQTNHPEKSVELIGRAVKFTPQFAPVHNNLGLGLGKLNRCEEALASYNRAIALKPDFAVAYSNRGSVLQQMDRYDEALASYDKAIALKPDYAEAYSGRGYALQQIDRYQDAFASYDKAIALKPDYAEAYSNRGTALQRMSRYEEALSCYDRAIALKPDYAEAYSNRGHALEQMSHYEEALSSYDKAIALKPDCADACANRGITLLVLGRLEQGWQQYEWRKKARRPVGNRVYPQPPWLGQENIAGKTLFLYWEQGLGDTIQFVRYAKLVRAMGARVIVSVQDPLLRLLRQMDPLIEFIGGDAIPEAFDYHCPMMTLPLALRTTLETIPAEPFYLQTEKELSAHWATRLSALNGLRVGLVWAGGRRDHPDLAIVDSRRSIPLATYSPLASIPNVSFVSLQKGAPSAEARVPPEAMILHDWTDELLDFLDTAALIDGLDLVISVDTAVAHLAGALGKPVWVLNRSNTCWRWLLDRTDSPWYPSLRLFRQHEMGNWSSVIEEVRRELGARVPELLATADTRHS
jgi:tetratricopeptide (TPR) repeat protein